MKITLTITISKMNRLLDIQVNHEQKIKDTLAILKDNLIPQLNEPEKILYIQSNRTKRKINTELTYEQAGIYEGENLIL